MALTLIVLMILGTWTSQAMSRTLHEAAVAERHKQWMVHYGRTYETNVEKERRFKIFKDNLEFIETFNNAGNRTYKLGINEFADLTNEEFMVYRTGYDMSTHPRSSKATSFRYENVTEVPTSMDWRKKGAVTTIKRQGQCGCCWAFSAVAAIEGIIRIKTGNLVSLSEQQLLDCDTDGNNQGCEGGWMGDAFEYIIKNQGLTSETNYPYMEMQGTCDTDKAAVPAAQISSYENVPSNNEEALLKAVTRQPVSVAIDGSGYAFKLYSNGVFDGDCGTSLNHAVTIIGYGTSEDGTNYWLAKNSWGQSWGESGYMRILRGVDAPEGLCGVAMQAIYPLA